MIDNPKEIETIRMRLATSLALSKAGNDPVVEGWGIHNVLLATLTESGGYLNACVDYNIISDEISQTLLKEITESIKKTMRELK